MQAAAPKRLKRNGEGRDNISAMRGRLSVVREQRGFNEGGSGESWPRSLSPISVRTMTGHQHGLMRSVDCVRYTVLVVAHFLRYGLSVSFDAYQSDHADQEQQKSVFHQRRAVFTAQ
jgi:hypothetical protein